MDVELKDELKSAKHHRKAITDAPNLRGCDAMCCDNCTQFQCLEGCEEGICLKYEFETSGEYVCDSHEPIPPVPQVEVTNMPEGMLCYFGSEVKATEDGRVSGYLVRFSTPADTDLSGDYFTPNTDFGGFKSAPVYYHHGLDKMMKTRVLGSGSLKIDALGVWIEAQLNLRDKYEKAIYKLAKMGKLGWSSGTAPHLVERKAVGKSSEITKWPLGLDASLTPTPAEPRNVAEVKSLKLDVQLEPETEAEGRETAPVVKAQITNQSTGETEMTPEEVNKAVADALAQRDAAAKKEAEDKAAFEAKVAEAVKAKLEPVNAGLKSGGPALNLKAPKGDTAWTAMNHWIATGDNGGLRANPEYKTDYNLLGGTQYQGQELVPTEILNEIFELRQPLSIARAAGAQVRQVNSRTNWVPVEKSAPDVWVVTAEEAAYDIMEQQPLDKKIVTIQKYTRSVKIAEELIDDGVVDVSSWFPNYAARGLALTENQEFLIGDGSGNALGTHVVTTGHTAGVTAASATTVTAAEIVKLYYKIPAEYRDNVVWTMAGATEGIIRGLTGNWFNFIPTAAGQGGLAQGTGWMVDPRSRVFNSSSCPAATASLIPIVVGNFSAGYVICENRQMRIMRDPYSYAANGQVAIHCSTRFGGTVVNPLAFYGLTMATG